MRADMKKVLCERPRAGSHRCYREVRAAETRRAYDDLPTHQGMRQPYRAYGDYKEFRDHIGPLQRFLRSAVGRRWDDVWSEIAKLVNSGNTIDDHLRGHIWSEIDTQTSIVDGRVCSHNSAFLLADLYVDPRDGLIYAEPKTKPAWRLMKVVVVDGLSYKQHDDGLLHPFVVGKWYPGCRSGRYLLKVIGDRRAMHINGIWYWIISAEVPPPNLVPYLKDGKVCYRTIHHPRYDFVCADFVETGRYYVEKWQMNSHDLRRHGLRNP